LYAPPGGEQGGGLSYAADLGGFRLLALDTCKYSADTAGREGGVAGGMITEGQMEWVLGELAAAREAGRPVIGMGHHNLTEHLGYEGVQGTDFMLDGYRETRETLADAGLHFYLSGHVHIEEIGRAVSDSGEALYDIANSALILFPYTFRVIEFSAGGGRIAAQVSTLPIDGALPVTAAGVTYPKPYAKTGFAASFWGTDSGLAGFAAEYINRMLGRQLKKIGEAGGVDAFLKQSGTDIGASLRKTLGGILAQPLAGLIEDLLAQIDALYVGDPARLESLLGTVLGKLFRLRVSKLPCTAFIGSLGFGGSGRPGTLEDFGNSALAYIFGHVGDYTADAFFMDVVGGIQSGALLDELLGNAVGILLEDVIGGELLPALRFNARSVFASQLGKDTLGCLLDVALGALRDVFSRSKVLGLLRSLGWLGLGAAAKPVVGLALPASLKASLNSALARLVHEMVLGRAPDGDKNALLVYDGPVQVEIGGNREFRAPIDISVKRGEDGTTAEITWYTKRSVAASDVVFSPPIEGLTATAETQDATRTVNAIDLGVAAVGGEQLKATKHTVVLAGLAPGVGYSLRVGDERRGWLSEPIALGG
ncbi:MAG: fibronectin type III domain-containing protein, partial [Oscillospiraceae bacterium]|nr:fibronectin type III domain-containing protein [Oscillospiraceae bacterium]